MAITRDLAWPLPALPFRRKDVCCPGAGGAIRGGSTRMDWTDWWILNGDELFLTHGSLPEMVTASNSQFALGWAYCR